MTTIVYANGVMAADTLATWGSNRDGYFTKIAKRGPFLCGVSGAVASCQRFLDWFRTGCIGDPPQMPDGDQTTHGLIITPDDWVLLYGPRGWEKTRKAVVCLGSGAEFAEGAMSTGVTPGEAVRIAGFHDTETGGDITVLRR